MVRVAVLALLLGLAGCGAPPLAGEAHFAGLTSREAHFVVRHPDVESDWGEIALYATVTAPGAEWALLRRQDEGLGPSQRTVDGVVELSIDRSYEVGGACEGRCERHYVVALDADPAGPWELHVEAVIYGDAPEGGAVEIALAP